MERKHANNKNNGKNETSNVAAVVNKILKKKAELKSFDVGFGTTVDSTGTLTKISSIPQGDTDSTRDGDQLLVTRISLRGTLANSSSDLTNVMRVIIFKWMQDDASAGPVSATDILQSLSPYSPYDRDGLRAKKFIVLLDRFLTTSLQGPAIMKYDYDSKHDFKISYSAGAVTGYSNIYVLQISDSSGIPHPTGSWISRVWFNDF